MPDPLPLLQSFTHHAARHDWQPALRAASSACHAAPALPAAHYAYGQAWLALGEAQRAEQAFAASVRLAPGWADAWVNLGLALYRQGRIEHAKTAMRTALRHQPGHQAAIANLGAFLRISGEAETAEMLLRACLAAEPGNAGARLNLAADLLTEERPADALALLREVPPPADDPPLLRHWYLQSSLALIQLRQIEAARAELHALAALGPIPPALAPLWHWRQLLLALAGDEPAIARHEAARMSAALDSMGPDGVLEHKIMARFDLAKFWSGQNDAAQAFQNWQAGHDLLRRIQPFSRAEQSAFLDATKAAFSATRMRGPRAGNQDRAPIFIVGMPRSGTTLCEQILAAHPDAHGAGERAALALAFTRLGGPGPQSPARIAALDTEALDQAATRYLAELHALAPDKARIVDKMPGNLRFLGLVGLMLPGARIIHCVRDPRDIGLSIFTFRFHGAHGYAHDLGDLGWMIHQSDKLMRHWQDVLPNPILTLALGDWVEDFDATLARLLAHVGLPHHPDCARFHERDSRVRTVSRAQVRQPINARGLGRWRGYAAQLAPLIAELERGGMLQE